MCIAEMHADYSLKDEEVKEKEQLLEEKEKKREKEGKVLTSSVKEKNGEKQIYIINYIEETAIFFSLYRLTYTYTFA